jgi:hypothetical protein
MAAKPVVDGIEREHAQSLVIVRLNFQDPVGQVLADRFQVSYTPTFLFFNAGQEEWRTVGAVDPGRVRESLQQP